MNRKRSKDITFYIIYLDASKSRLSASLKLMTFQMALRYYKNRQQLECTSESRPTSGLTFLYCDDVNITASKMWALTCLKVKSLVSKSRVSMAFEDTRGRRTCSQMSTPRIGVCAREKNCKLTTAVTQLPIRHTNQRILVCSGNNLERLGTFVVSLTSQNWELVHLKEKERSAQANPIHFPG